MAMKFTLNPNPTFKCAVTIPRAGDDDGVLTFTFKHKRRSEIEALEKKLTEGVEALKSDQNFSNEPTADYVLEISEGWGLPDEFNRKNIIELLENYPRAFDSIAAAYTREMMALREKN